MISNILRLLGKKYTLEILIALENIEDARFKDLKKACPIEKMRMQRLRELEENGLIKSSVITIGRRPITVYNISEKGEEVLTSIMRLRDTLKKFK